jgi:hypothetical protein
MSRIGLRASALGLFFGAAQTKEKKGTRQRRFENRVLKAIFEGSSDNGTE